MGDPDDFDLTDRLGIVVEFHPVHIGIRLSGITN